MFEEEEGKPRKMVMVTVEGKETMKAMVKKEMIEDKRKRGGGVHAEEVFFLKKNLTSFSFSHIIYLNKIIEINLEKL